MLVSPMLLLVNRFKNNVNFLQILINITNKKYNTVKIRKCFNTIIYIHVSSHCEYYYGLGIMLMLLKVEIFLVKTSYKLTVNINFEQP